MKNLEKDIAARSLPGLKISRVEYLEGGFFSDKRTYLRLARERYSFDVCASKFGRAFFFSIRLVETKTSMGALIVFCMGVLMAAYVILMTAQAIGSEWSTHADGICGWGLGIVVALTLLKVVHDRGKNSPPPGTLVKDGGRVSIIVERLSRFEELLRKRLDAFVSRFRSGTSDLRDFFCSVPLIGPWIERMGRETYFRYDTRLLYLSLVNEIVKKRVGEVTAANGVKFIETHEYSPVFADLYRTTKSGEESKIPEPVPV
ncbi:MAG TPA: hypothetical protein VGL42_00190 [Opitutaceae bacterium]